MALLTEKAQTLPEAIRNLDPMHSLTVAELSKFYVEREGSPIKYIAVALEDAYPQKFLFTGHRGTGKSTELAKLEAQLEDSFFVVRYALKNVLDLYDLTYVDVLLSIAIQMIEKVKKAEEIKLSRNTERNLERLWSFGKEMEQELETGKAEGGEAEIGSSGFLSGLLKVAAKIRTESTTRQVLRERVQHRISELLEGIDILARDIESQTDKRLLCIVEDLDKTDLTTAEDIFYKHGKSISAPETAIIYTFPVALSHSNEFTQVRQYFSDNYALPNFKLENKDESSNEVGKRALERLLQERVEGRLLAGGALDLLVKYSGGVPRQLIALARDACLEARVQNKTCVSENHVEEAIARERRNFDRILSKAQLQLLGTIKATREIDQTDEYRELLHALSVLEYSNHELWYDVNPFVDDLLD